MNTTFCAEDLVARRINGAIGVIERTLSEISTHEQFDEGDEYDRDEGVSRADFRKFLSTGVPPKHTVAVRWCNGFKVTLIGEAKLGLIDRSLWIGAIVKRGALDAMSGVIVNLFTKCTLRPLSEARFKDRGTLLGWPSPESDDSRSITFAEPKPPLVDVPASELKYGDAPSEEDLIIYKDWIGRVMDVRHKIAIKLTDGYVVEIEDDRAVDVEDSDGPFDVGDIIFSEKGHLRTGRWIHGRYNPNTPPAGTVVQTRPTTCTVLWLRQRMGDNKSQTPPPEVLEREEIESSLFHVYDRTAVPTGPAADQSTEVLDQKTLSVSEIDVVVGLRVRFKDVNAAFAKYTGFTANGQFTPYDRRSTLGYDLNVFEIESRQTQVTVQWQDLSITYENSTDVVPEDSIDDDHAAWPGEVVHTLDYVPVHGMEQVEMPSKVGIVQSVKADERVARVLWCPSGYIHYSVDVEKENRSREVVTAVIGKTSEELEEISLYEVEAPGGVNVRRGDIVLIDSVYLESLPFLAESRGIPWLGEIVDTRLDGRLTVRLGAAVPVRDIVLNRENVVVAVRSDDFVDAAGDDSMDLDDWSLASADSVGPREQMQMRRRSTNLRNASAIAYYMDEDGEFLDPRDVEDGDWESDDDGDDDNNNNNDNDNNNDDNNDDKDVKDLSNLPVTDHPPVAHDDEPGAIQSYTTLPGTAKSCPEQYSVLDSPVPPCHHFVSQAKTETAAHIKRTLKEHRMLSSEGSLPNGVYVRSWESRMDLLRVLIIGPNDTPYRNAPFVLDLYLPPQFPNEPPLAHFHSWQGESGLGGVGRVNPNLNEDGKICLSLLGTWSGEQSTSWSAAHSTLLQVIVSILGLVLVKDPYYNEAGYENLVGLESSQLASKLYSERVYLRTRSFILTACQAISAGSENCVGLEGLRNVMEWVYWGSEHDGSPLLLRRTLADIEGVLDRSENGVTDANEHDMVSKGACIPLRKVFGRLNDLATGKL